MTTIQYDLRTGYPDTSILVPHETLGDIARQLIQENLATQYAGLLIGPERSRDTLAQFIAGMTGATLTADNLIITAGAINGINIACRGLTQPGDVVIVEEPTFYFIVNILRASHVEVVSAPMTDQGVDLNAVADLATQYGDRLKMIYTIPSFHNPTGIVATEANRRELVKLAQKHDFVIVEDTTYQWLYFEDAPPAMCQAYDETGEHVVSVGTFSKIMMPSIRQGWLWTSSSKVKQFTNFCDSSVGALAAEMVAQFIRQGHIQPQLAHARAHYAERCHAMAAILQDCLPDWVQWQKPGGGFFFWMTLPEGVSSMAVLEQANARGVDFMPGKMSFVNRDSAPDRYLRVCFTYNDIDKLEQGARLLAESLQSL